MKCAIDTAYDAPRNGLLRDCHCNRCDEARRNEPEPGKPFQAYYCEKDKLELERTKR